MLLLYLCLFGCCLSLSVGNEIEEFKKNLEDVLKLTNKQIFLPVPKRIQECKCAHDYLSNIVKYLEKLTPTFNDEEKVKRHLNLMYLNVKHLMARLKKGDEVNSSKNCEKREKNMKNAWRSYILFFESLNEFNCFESQ